MSDMAAETRLVGGGLASLPRVNLLPPEIAEAAQFRKVQAGLAGAVALAIAAAGFLYVGATDSVSTAEDRVTTATAEQTVLQKQKSDLGNVTAVYAQAQAAQALLVQAMGQEVRYSRFLNDLSLTIPDDVWIGSATYAQSGGAAASPTAARPTTTTTTTPTGAGAAGAAAAIPGAGIGTLTVTGVAFEHNDVAAWLDAQAKSAGLVSPTLQTSTRALLGKRTVIQWSASVTLSTKALSGRYAPAGG